MRLGWKGVSWPLSLAMVGSSPGAAIAGIAPK